ncbi:MarR family winged helix-turn-helix transcriptional regulator [Sphingomonas sp.]|jgi:DNA-binding MarR family transcriptional regulator|uniref:MarR family winged helix-turn-helix transcriptional regulator n=1 Tax=Sphingomonas sp. TaxID=28214 RepID=UPI0035C7EB22
MANRLQLDRFLPYRLSITSNLVSGRIARVYESLFGLSIPEWRLITVTAEAGAITQAELGERTRMDKVTVSRAAIALVGRGLLARTPNANDRRSHLLSLTEEGEALYGSVAPKAMEIEERLFSRFTPAELETFTAMLRRIDAAAQEEA